MSDLPRSPSLLREQAEFCRSLASGMTNRDMSRKLLALAHQLDKEASELKPEDVAALPRRRADRPGALPNDRI